MLLREKIKECFLFYFPLKVAIIDDDINFLNIIADYLDHDNISIYSSPEEALQDIKPVNFQIKNFIKESHEEIFDINYKNIRKCLEENINNFGIIISDYRMPNINGIELLSNFKNSEILKILLTGEFNIENAVKALNDKTIDYYLPKDNVDSIAEISMNLESSLFRKITKEIIDNIEKDNLSFLKDANYIAIFNEICHRHKITNYCLINSYGGYLLGNEKEKLALTIFHKNYLDEISEELTDTEKIRVKNRECIPGFFSKEQNKDTLLPCEHIGDYSFCIEKLS